MIKTFHTEMPKLDSSSRAWFSGNAALLASAVGAVGSVGCQLYVGRHNKSWLAMGLIAVWVISPFVILMAVHLLAKRWPALGRTEVHLLAFVITLISLAAYASVAFGPSRPKPAVFFVVIPPLSLILIAIVLTIVGLTSRRRS